MARTKTPAERALGLLNDVLEHETTDDQAIEMAKAYALAGWTMQQGQITEVLKELAIAASELASALAPILDSVAAQQIAQQAKALSELASSGVEENMKISTTEGEQE